MKNNNFKIGEKVVCINNSSNAAFSVFPTLKLGKVYEVKDFQYCVKCGLQAIDVNTSYEFHDGTGFDGQSHYCKCGNFNVNIVNTPCSSIRFVSLDNLEQFIAECEENEEYELCEILTKILKSELC